MNIYCNHRVSITKINTNNTFIIKLLYQFVFVPHFALFLLFAVLVTLSRYCAACAAAADASAAADADLFTWHKFPRPANILIGKRRGDEKRERRKAKTLSCLNCCNQVRYVPLCMCSRSPSSVYNRHSWQNRAEYRKRGKKRARVSYAVAMICLH